MGHVQTTIRKLITWAQVQIYHFATNHSRQSVYTNIRHSNEGQFTAVKLEHTLAVITWPYCGLIFQPIEVTYVFKFSADILFNHGLNCLFLAEPHGKIYPSQSTNRTPTAWPSAPQAYQCLISHFLARLGACSLILYIHVTIHVVVNWQLSKQCIHRLVSPDHIAGSGIDSLSSSVFWNYPLTSYYFSNNRRLKFIFCCVHERHY